MTNDQAAALIESMARSIESRPSQFQINISASAVGISSSVSNGGTGISVSVSGGGPGSTTIGMKSSISTGDVKIAIEAAEDVMNSEIRGLVHALDLLSAEFRKANPEATVMRKIMSSLGGWVPPVITGVLANVISHQLGS